MIAVCLLTCDRVPYTRVTVDSWARFNGGDPRFLLLHGDDASEDATNGELARAHGFRTVVQHQVRKGNVALRTALIEIAAQQAPWIFILENDIESLRPFPWEFFYYAAGNPKIACVRLYGQFKDRDGLDPCLATHKRENHAPVKWSSYKYAPEPGQVGRIHWSAQPAVTRSRAIQRLHQDGTEPDGLTVRVKQNVMAHIGLERTAPIVRETVPA